MTMKTITETEAGPLDQFLGKKVFMRTVTMHHVGMLVAVGDNEIVLKDAAWVADSGRFSEALVTGVLSEVEPFPDGQIVVGRAALIDMCEWTHDLPRVAQ